MTEANLAMAASSSSEELAAIMHGLVAIPKPPPKWRLVSREAVSHTASFLSTVHCACATYLFLNMEKLNSDDNVVNPASPTSSRPLSNRLD